MRIMRAPRPERRASAGRAAPERSDHKSGGMMSARPVQPDPSSACAQERWAGPSGGQAAGRAVGRAVGGAIGRALQRSVGRAKVRSGGRTVDAVGGSRGRSWGGGCLELSKNLIGREGEPLKPPNRPLLGQMCVSSGFQQPAQSDSDLGGLRKSTERPSFWTAPRSSRPSGAQAPA